MRPVTKTTSSIIILLLTTTLFIIPLWYAWAAFPLGIWSPSTASSTLNGIIPWNDAGGYYSGANHLLDNAYLDAWNTRRPLNAILFSIRLWLSQGNFSTALILQALLCGISCALVTLSVMRRFGVLSGIASLTVLFLFGGTFIPTTLSETLGLTLGCFSFVLLWEGVLSKQLWLMGAASFLFTIGLNARAGAFFLLPILVIWTGYYFKELKKFNWRSASLIVLCVSLGFAYNMLMAQLYGDPAGRGAMHGNFSQTLFGLVAGGKTWAYVHIAYPDFSGSEADFSHFLYLESLKLFIQNPFLLLWGLFKSTAAALKGAFSFFQTQLPNHLFLKSFIRILGILFFSFSLWKLRKLQKQCTNVAMINMGLLAMALSATVIWTDGGFRVFAVTVPFLAAAVGIVVAPTQDCVTTLTMTKHKKNDDIIIMTLILSFILLSSAAIMPKLLTPPKNNLNAFAFSCPKNQIQMTAHNISGSPQVKLIPPADQFKKNVLKSNIQSKSIILRIFSSDILSKPLTLGDVYDISAKRTKLIVGTPEAFENKGLVGLCITPVSNTDNSIFQIQSFEVFDGS